MSALDSQSSIPPLTSSSRNDIPNNIPTSTATTNNSSENMQSETNPAKKESSYDQKNNDTTTCDHASTKAAAQPSNKIKENVPNSMIDGCNKGEYPNEGLNTDTSYKDESQDKNNDSSTLSTAFTVSFEDDKPFSKKLGIRDSIRKFAPPKPNTIEKPRPPKANDSGQESSLMSVESAPAGFAAPNNFSRGSNNRRSTPSRSNISESAAFLIDKMLNCQRKGRDDVAYISSRTDNTAFISKKSLNPNKKKQPVQSNVEVLEDEVDYCEEMSDNGTYIVGNDPEADAARKRMDELFGVVKAAEASLMSNQQAGSRVERPSRSTTNQQLSRERQERINRLAQRHPSASRSSSSSRQETKQQLSGHKPRASSRNSSCDRTISRPQHGSRKPRSVSQSSRQSSGKEDTRSSHSSLHNDIDSLTQEASMNPSMKFNRAFALRRARLGLGEPTRAPLQDNETSFSPKRAANPSKGGQNAASSSSLSRNDGGRFSLRSKNNAISSRLSQLPSITRNQLPGSLVETYVSRGLPPRGPAASLQQSYQRNTSARGPTTSTPTAITSSAINDDLVEANLSPKHKNQLLADSSSGRLMKKPSGQQNEFAGSDTDSYYNRYNNSLCNDHQQDIGQTSNCGDMMRACSSAGKRGSAVELGSLDSLVLSAISSLSLKIRQSVCEVMVDHAKRLPDDNGTRLIMEEIVPELAQSSARSRSPTRIEEIIDQPLYFDLAQTLKNLKKVEKMLDVIKDISNQIPTSPLPQSASHSSSLYLAGTSGSGNQQQQQAATGTLRASDSSNGEIDRLS